MNARDIIRKFLADNGYDGLTNGGCGCGLDDLMSTDECTGDCVPAKRSKCNQADCPAPGFCMAYETDGDIWCYRPVKTTN